MDGAERVLYHHEGSSAVDKRARDRHLVVSVALVASLAGCTSSATPLPPRASPAASSARPSAAARTASGTPAPTSMSATSGPSTPPTGTDDTALLQAALNTCVPGGARCVVRLPAGTYWTKQVVADNFHGSIVGAGEATTIIEALPGYVVGTVWTEPASASNPWPYILTFGRTSDVRLSDLSFRVSAATPVPQGWHDPFATSGGTATNGPVTWLEGAVFVEGSARFARLFFEGAAGTTSGLDAMATAGSNLDTAVQVDEAHAPAGVFVMTVCRTQGVGEGFEVSNFRGRATIGGSPIAANTFADSSGGVYWNLSGATVSESYDRVQGGPVSGDTFADWFDEDRPATQPSSVLLRDNAVALAGPTASGVVVWYPTPMDTLLHLTITHNDINVRSLRAVALYARNISDLVIADNTVRGSGPAAIAVVSAGPTLQGNTLGGFAAATASIILGLGTSGAHVTCTSPADTLLDHGTGDTVTGCHLAGHP